MADDGMADVLPRDLPFTAEYAKTSRGSCRGCKSVMEKDELKLGVMVQSRFHDGKDPYWYHPSCFFKRSHPKTVGDIANFEKLRFNDQEMIRKQLGSVPAAGASADGLTAKQKLALKQEALKDYTVGYALSGRSTCPVCEEKIALDEVRISKKDYDSEEAIRISSYTGNAGLDRFHHVECFVKVREEFGFFESGKLLPGIKTLQKDDRDHLARVLPAIKPTTKPVPSATATSASATTKSPAPATVTSETVTSSSSTKASKKSKSSRKRKSDDKSAATGSSKRAKKGKKKEEDEEEVEEVEESKEELLKKQMDLLYKYRDAVKDNVLARKDLLRILSYNNQEMVFDGGELLDRIADIMTFGALERCPKCKLGQFVFTSGVGYRCHGDLNEFTKCMNKVQEPERAPFKVPKSLRKNEAFVSYEFKPQTRILQKVLPSVKPAGGAYVTPKLVKQPLKDFGFLVSCVGDKKKEKELKDKIEGFSGEVLKARSTKAAALITTEDEMTKGSPATKFAEKKGIPVLKEQFIHDIKELNYDLVAEMTKNLICSWVPDITTWLKTKNGDFEAKQTIERKATVAANDKRFEKKQTSVKMKMKGGCVVDPESDLEDVGHVFKDGKKGFYNCVLNRTSIEEGKNSYYKMQIIEADSGGMYFVFQAWGRVGTICGGKKIHDHVSQDEAIEIFCTKFEELTGNIWGRTFVKLPRKYAMLQLDYGEKEQLKKLAPSTTVSALPIPVQELVSLIFDVDRMKQAMMEFELNLEEMPLGKISRQQVLNAYTALGEASKAIQKYTAGDAEAGDQIRDVTNRFYTMIPHNLGTRMPPLLDNDDLVKTKLEMLESLLEIELAYEMLLEGNKDTSGESPIDSHYKTLSAAIDPVETGSEEFGLLQKYLQNTHADTHSSYTLDIEHIFKVKREGEGKKKGRKQSKYEKLHNRKLLWHGSRTTNYAGILSQGLRIAPKEAPVTGYMFGKGVYFADMVSKSANYCYPSQENNCGLLLLCEVALGDMHELTEANDQLVKAPSGFHSVKGLGMTHPDPKEIVTLPDGIQVPLGKPTPSNVKKCDLLYNEYIVYDTEQINIRYLMKVNFNFRSGRRH